MKARSCDSSDDNCFLNFVGLVVVDSCSSSSSVVVSELMCSLMTLSWNSLMRVMSFSFPPSPDTDMIQYEEGEQEVRVSELFNTLLFTEQQEVRLSQLFNTQLFSQQEEQEVRLSQLFNTQLFSQQEEQELRVSELFNTLLFSQQEEQEVRVRELFNTLLFS